MTSLSRAGHWLAAPILCACLSSQATASFRLGPDPASRQAADATSPMALLDDWLDEAPPREHPGAQGRTAYRLQDGRLRLRGLEADVNRIAVALEAGCTPSDIHPE